MRVRDARQTFLGWWIRQVIEGAEIHVYGDGTQLRDFTYIDDAVEALLEAASSDACAGEVLNVGGDAPISLRDLAELLVALNGSGRFSLLPFPPDQKAIDIGHYYTDDRKLRGLLDWRPRVTLRDGLARTLAFYREHRAQYWTHA
jgi:UDP-glucose 4-epimerase